MQHRRLPIRLRLAKAILGGKAKEFIPSLSYWDGYGGGVAGRFNDYLTARDQLSANVGWCFAANNAIVETAAAVELKLYRKRRDGKREEILQHELLDLLDKPNNAHTGEQMRGLHFTYMNFIGEAYVYMRDRGGNAYEPRKGRLPAALEVLPAHEVQFKLDNRGYSQSTIRYGQNTYPLLSVIRDLNPDPARPYYGRSIIRASAQTLDTDWQMKEWNRSFFANNARPSLIFKTNEPLDQDSYDRWKAQFRDENTGTDNAFKPLLIEGGDATPYMLNQQDLDFLNSRKFSRDEILAMWRVSPGIIGAVENVNRANLEAGFYIHAVINIRPRVRQFVKQLNASLVSTYDPTLELGFSDPVPEDTEAKLRAAQAGVDKWWTKDEVREQYGDAPLPDGLGGQLYMANNNAPLSVIAEPPAPSRPTDPEPPAEGGAPADKAASSGIVHKAPPAVPEPEAPADVQPDSETVGEAKVERRTRQATGHEARMTAAMRDEFERQRQQIVSRLDTSKIGKRFQRDGKRLTYSRKDWLSDLLDWASADESFADAIKGVIQTVLMTTGRDAMADIGVDPNQYDPFTPALREYFTDRPLKIARDVNDETEKQLRASLSQGVLAGESTYELRARVEAVMGSASTMRADSTLR